MTSMPKSSSRDCDAVSRPRRKSRKTPTCSSIRSPSEDIGALPDRSVTEALQRIPGVSISRFAAGADPDHFSIEGSGVVVRGLPQVRSELNGRDTFSANSGRFLSFSDVPPELLGGVDVYKNQSAEMIEGGLAGTVNLRTRCHSIQRTVIRRLARRKLWRFRGGMGTDGSAL